MQPSNLPFAWLKIMERFTHQQQHTLCLQVLAFIWKQVSLASSSTTFFRTHLPTHYLYRFSENLHYWTSSNLVHQEAESFLFLTIQ
ncbi:MULTISPECIES: hypothetical protein [unclassified Tolypothrix]|uniref:hypothetical protein n=1 Tax=unclassified Tolypothrix TaxID=2649714 RepID=UPI0005F7FC04|nr:MULTISPECIES: hypothetical protein [unclassified Tolypothrix]MBE9083299.1 hypothetical protein [Tolypothrix sp. LEGE 11397]UYD25659.1 hypothetical protein HGR01_30695 [Tolypothrix sp. PCC 7712]UYD32100.1 hypothetical protein HG267_23845 [Tolypothrix sp. PCC 7601]